MSTEKKRHGCLAVALAFTAIMSTITFFSYIIAMITPYKMGLPAMPVWLMVIYTITALLNVIWVFALFSWKKWGFWGFVITAVLTGIVNSFLGYGIILQVVTGIIAVAILFGILHIGKEKKAWPQLD